MSEPRDDQRWADILRAGSADARPRADCPDADRIWLAVSHELPFDERAAIIDHISDCGVCAESWRLASELSGAAADANTRETTAHPAHAWMPATRAAWVLATAAVLVLCVGAALLPRLIRDRVDPGFRGTRGLQSELPPGASLPRDDFRLRWTAGPAGATYTLTVTTEDLDVLVSVRGLDRPEYRVAPEALFRLPAGTRLRWRVVAEMPEGGSTASPTYEVTLR